MLFEDLGLEAPIQEVLDFLRKPEIETHAGLVKHADTDETSDKGVTLEEMLGVLGLELQQFTRSTTNLGKDKGNTPNLALVTEFIFAGVLHL